MKTLIPIIVGLLVVGCGKGMRTLLIVLFCLCPPLMAADKKPLTKEESAKAIEAAIREALKKPAGELTKADYEKVSGLFIDNIQLTDVKGLEKLTQLKGLALNGNKLTDVKFTVNDSPSNLVFRRGS